jgi:hypothetical protein
VAKTSAFNTWVLRFDTELRNRTCLSWIDACGDPEPLDSYYQASYTPEQAVSHFINKFNLDRVG